MAPTRLPAPVTTPPGLRVKIVPLPGLSTKGDSERLARHGAFEGGAHRPRRRQPPCHAPDHPRHLPPAANALHSTSLGDFLAEPDEQHHYITEGCLAAGDQVNLMSREAEGRRSPPAARHWALESARGAGAGSGVRANKARSGISPSRDAAPTSGSTSNGWAPRRAGAASRLHRTGACRRRPRAQGARHPRTPAFHHHRHDAAAAQGEVHRRATPRMSNPLDDVIAIARESDAAVLLLHHNSKSDRPGLDSVLGSTAISGSSGHHLPAGTLRTGTGTISPVASGPARTWRKPSSPSTR